MSLNLVHVRELANAYGWREVQFNHTSRVISFRREYDERVNVYYTTGTVGTCLDHPIRSKTKLFRRNQTLEDLREISQNPRVHTGAGYYRRHGAAHPEPSAVGSSHANARSHTITAGVRANIFPTSRRKFFLENFNLATTVSVALGEEGFFCIEKDGQPWWHTIPQVLRNKVVGRQKSLPSPDFIAMGPEDQWFIQFCGGQTHWAGLPSSLEDCIFETSEDVEFLALGPDDAWYLLLENGSSAWANLPRQLYNLLNGRQKSLPGVEDLAIGENGNYFVRFKNGSWRAQLWHYPSLDETVDDLVAEGKDIARIRFGGDEQWVLCYYN